MKRLLIYIVLLLLFACEAGELESNQLLVEGYLYAGADSQQIHLRSPEQQGSSTEVIDDAEVSLYGDNKEYELIHIADGMYRYDGADLKITPERTYYLEVSYEEQEIMAETTVPSTPVGLVSDQDTLVIDESFSDFIIFSWLNPDSKYYSPLIRSRTSHADSLFNDQVNLFNFSYPQVEGEVVVNGSNIKFFGQNEFILYSVTNEYLDLYQFTDQESELIQPGNIQNGLGVFTSFSSDTVSFFVEGF